MQSCHVPLHPKHSDSQHHRGSINAALFAACFKHRRIDVLKLYFLEMLRENFYYRFVCVCANRGSAFSHPLPERTTATCILCSWPAQIKNPKDGTGSHLICVTPRAESHTGSINDSELMYLVREDANHYDSVPWGRTPLQSRTFDDPSE